MVPAASPGMVRAGMVTGSVATGGVLRVALTGTVIALPGTELTPLRLLICAAVVSLSICTLIFSTLLIDFMIAVLSTLVAGL